MSAEVSETKSLSVFERIIGIFASPKEAFQDINNKPTWLIPFIILLVTALIVQYLLLDIGVADQIAMLETRDMPEAQMEMAKNQMQGPLKYAGFIIAPIMILLSWCIASGIHLFFTNTVFNGQTSFKKLFSVISWSGLITVISTLLRWVLVTSKGTSHGVTTSLAILMPTPGLAETPSILFRLLAHINIFTIWGLVLYSIGISQISALDIKKSATVVIIVWLIWVAVSIPLWSAFGAIVLMGG